MDKQTFSKCLVPALTYYGKPLDVDVLEIYWQELGGFTERQMESAVRAHIANSKFFPKIPDLRRWITGKEETYKPRPDTDNSEMNRHREAAERVFEALVDGGRYEAEGTFRYPVDRVAKAALAVYRHYAQETSDKSARGHAYSAINQWTQGKFS